MEQPLFTVNQEVTPAYADWQCTSVYKGSNFPQFGKIYIVSNPCAFDIKGRIMIRLAEMPAGAAYYQHGFAPVLPGEVIVELVEESLCEPITK